ncbi:MAG: TIGR01212 family radical SAM protein [Chromatiaceae bacterium]
MPVPCASSAPSLPSSLVLSDRVSTFGQYLLRRYGERVHKLAIHAGFTCPNRDGTKGRGGCTFCNNASFNPQGREPPPIEEQIAAGRAVLARRTGARRFLGYFQAYTNTYDDLDSLRRRYDRALACPGVIGLSVGTRPDCVGDGVLDLLAGYRARGLEVWLELGLQSANDETLERVNRGHGLAEYRQAVQAAHHRGLPVCTHLILGLPGEGSEAALASLEQVLALGIEGLKLHPLHVVRHTRLALDWRRGAYQPLAMQDYVDACADLIERTPASVLYHRLTGTASTHVLLAPHWCSKKWAVLNAIEAELRRRGSRQGCRTADPIPQALSA